MATRYETTKRFPALSFEGYSYRFDKTLSNSTKKQWRCRTRDCNGFLYTANNQENSFIETKTPHREQYIPDPEGRCIEKVVSDLKTRVRNEPTAATALYDEAAGTLSANPSIASRFPLFSQIDSSLYRERLSHIPSLPASRELLIIPNHLLETIAGSIFHLYSAPNNDILIFSTEDNILKLSTKAHWCVDGTFKSVPRLYLQLFTIHAFEGNKLIPLVYVYFLAKHVPFIQRFFDV